MMLARIIFSFWRHRATPIERLSRLTDRENKRASRTPRLLFFSSSSLIIISIPKIKNIIPVTKSALILIFLVKKLVVIKPRIGIKKWKEPTSILRKNLVDFLILFVPYIIDKEKVSILNPIPRNKKRRILFIVSPFISYYWKYFFSISFTRNLYSTSLVLSFSPSNRQRGGNKTHQKFLPAPSPSFTTNDSYCPAGYLTPL